MDTCVLGMAQGQVLHAQGQGKTMSATSQYQESGEPSRRKVTIHQTL